MNTTLPDGIIQTAEGIYVLRDDSHLSRWLEQHKRLDIAAGEIARWAKYIPFGGTVIDAGASLGDHCCTYAQLVGPMGNVFAFEPNRLAFKCLTLNFEGWHTVRTINAALSDEISTGKFYPAENAGASYVTDEADITGTLKMVMLDAYLPAFQRCDFIHLDVEGFERRALLGARALLQKFHPAIVLEINHGCLARYGLVEADVLATLTELGYGWQEVEVGHGTHLPQRDLLALPL